MGASDTLFEMIEEPSQRSGVRLLFGERSHGFSILSNPFFLVQLTVIHKPHTFCVRHLYCMSGMRAIDLNGLAYVLSHCVRVDSPNAASIAGFQRESSRKIPEARTGLNHSTNPSGALPLRR